MQVLTPQPTQPQSVQQQHQQQVFQPSHQVAQSQPVVAAPAQIMSPSMQAYTAGLGRASSSGMIVPAATMPITSHQHMDYLRQMPGSAAMNLGMPNF